MTSREDQPFICKYEHFVIAAGYSTMSLISQIQFYLTN